MDRSPERQKNLVNLLILFIGGYLIAVLVSWAILLIDYATSGGPESALSILTPAGLFLLYPLLPLISPFFFIPASAIIAFAVLAVEKPKPKRLVIAICAAVFLGPQILVLALWPSGAISLIASSFLLLIWLSAGLALVKIWQRLRPAGLIAQPQP